MSKFPSHGNVSAKIEDNLFIVDVLGPINIELVQKYERQAVELAKAFDADPWGLLLLARGVPLAPPDVEKRLIYGLSGCNALGLVAVSYVLLDDEFRNIGQSFWSNVFGQAKLATCQLADSRTQAMQWLTQCVEQAEDTLV